MRILFTTLIIFLISFCASAKTVIYKCTSDVYLKTENPLIGKRKIFHRQEGKWIEICNVDGSKFFSDGIKCMSVKDSDSKYFILDEFLNTLTFHEKNGKNITSTCKIIKNKNP